MFPISARRALFPVTNTVTNGRDDPRWRRGRPPSHVTIACAL